MTEQTVLKEAAQAEIEDFNGKRPTEPLYSRIA
jgi:hypothetical protein